MYCDNKDYDKVQWGAKFRELINRNTFTEHN